MSLYNRLTKGFDSEENGGKEDYYHGEYDDEAYGNLYIPHIAAEVATFDTVKQVFINNQVGLVTSVDFNELALSSSYKGKNKKQLYSAYVYVKWFADTEFREHIAAGNKNKSRVIVNNETDTYWIVRPNTAFPSEELLAERLDIEELVETATDIAMRSFEGEEEEEDLYELKKTAQSVALSLLAEDEEEELVLYDLEETAKDVALRVF